jgi:hypothetical protein
MIVYPLTFAEMGALIVEARASFEQFRIAR